MYAWGQKGTAIYGQRVYNNWSEKEIKDGNDFKNNIIESKENLEDVANFDFRLKKESKAIGSGLVIEGITPKLKGKEPSAGAYEYGEKPWVPGCTTKAIDNFFFNMEN